MPNNRKVYIIGHKNPDTDSICSAIAYADIKSRTDSSRIYAPRRAGRINEETDYVLKRFGVEEPPYVPDVGTQVQDMEIHPIEGIQGTISLKRAWYLMKEQNAVTLAITDEEQHLEGLITIGDIAKSYMDAYDNTIIAKARTQYQSIAETLDGKVLVGNPKEYYTEGKVFIGAVHPDMMGHYISKGDLVILGNRAEDHLCALEMDAKCLIVCLDSQVSPLITRYAQEKECVIITTPYDTFTVARLINQSIPVKFLMKTNNLITFRTDDFTDRIGDIMRKNRYRSFPVLNQKGKYVGTIGRRDLLSVHQKQMILVDHNEKSQAVDHIEETEILEIIDHHRLGSLETIHPVYFRNQPVGCTATIMYQIYQEKGLDIPQQIAGLLCSAIISDTLLFRSPTCTDYDREAANALAAIAGVNMEELASEMFRAGSDLSNKAPQDIFYQDFKKFNCEDIRLAVGQINSMSKENLASIRERLIPFIQEEFKDLSVEYLFFMLTDILEESTELLCFGAGAEDLVEEAFHGKVEQYACPLPGIVSRKKQLIPALIEAIHRQQQG
ncbi:MAG TPA: putative manganese-dependent inorganic diphosphatase [Candidatus Egerieimonas intestinavium]|uniref:inorganic diphosphatase n=1 Tax=Candidatus Egerieimonas intestinavium TaxID=2840777 RepID=A0A9D1EHH5_9FIRM|nr:putative manganese-dependent inorganic diphosphatase [Candidatus Egerieimonas intestinavium]